MRIVIFILAALVTTATSAQILQIPDLSKAVPYYQNCRVPIDETAQLAPPNRTDESTGSFLLQIQIPIEQGDSITGIGEYYQKQDGSILLDMVFQHPSEGSYWDGKIEGNQLIAQLTYAGSYTFFFSSKNRPGCQTIIQTNTSFVPPITIFGRHCSN